MENLETHLNEVARIAVRLEAETGWPAQLLIAQWAIESEWGTKPAGNANYFGVKKAARHQLCCTVTTHEVENGERIEKTLEFADYTSLEDSCRDYAWLITQGAPYSAAWAQYLSDRDLHALIRSIAGKYATNSEYPNLVWAVARQANVVRAISMATQETA
jgi:flagellum-specific peptidoglycan hydrolase FlgJ